MPLQSVARKAKSTAQKAPAYKGPRWGDPGVSETFIVQDATIAPNPNLPNQQIIMADAGILSEIQHHYYATNLTVTAGTGTASKDTFAGPYDAINWYQLLAGANTPLFSLSGRGLGWLQVVEYPGRSWEADAVPVGVENSLTNTSDFFNYPASGSNQVYRFWVRVPVALRWVGVPGGAVGHLILQNKRIANIIKPVFNLSGASAPFSLAASAAGNAPYIVTGNATVTATPSFETWKLLNTVPDSRQKMPLFGFTRYLQEVQVPYSGTSFTYSFEPGGMLLRALVGFYDATAAAGIATTNITNITYQYGTNKQLDVYTPQRNILEQLTLYGRTLPQGVFAFDYYTAKRSLVDAKSTENTANVQIYATFAQSYTPPANSVVNILLDKVFVVQNYLGH